MTEVYPSDESLNALSGTSDAEQAVLFPTIGESPYYTSFYKMLFRLMAVAIRGGDLRVYKDGDLTFGVRAGKFLDGDTVRNYTGGSEQALTNNATNYVYLTASATLTVNTTGFPTPSDTPHIPLATILTAAGTYAHSDITDYRGRAFLRLCSGLIPRSKLAQDVYATYRRPLSLCRQADGTAMPATAAGGSFGIDSGGWGSGTLLLKGEEANSNQKTDTLLLEFCLPPEYVAGAAVKVDLTARYNTAGSPTLTTKTIDLIRKHW